MLQLNFLKSLQCEAAAATFENKETFQMHQSVSLTASMPTTPVQIGDMAWLMLHGWPRVHCWHLTRALGGGLAAGRLRPALTSDQVIMAGTERQHVSMVQCVD